MPRSFGTAFVTELNKFADPLLPAPHPYWTAVFRFAAPIGNLYFSIGKTITVGANTYHGLITSTGPLTSLIDRREPLRLDIRNADLEFDNLPCETGEPTAGQRLSSYFAADLESVQIDVGLAFEISPGTFTSQVLFQGIAQADTTYGYRTARLSLVSYLNKYLGVQALRTLTDENFPYIRSSDNGKGEPIVIGSVRRAPGRVVKQGASDHPH